MLKKQPSFDFSKCTSCRICMQVCPVSCISMSLHGKQGKYKNVFPEADLTTCIGCGQCAAACPFGCITMKERQA